MRGFLVGAIIGAVAAALVAPRRGEETREMLRARAGTWQDQMMAKLDQARADMESMRRDVLARLDEMRTQFRPGQPPGPAGETPAEEEGGD